MAEKKMQLEDWLDDLCVRFIINLPEEDLSTVARICFHVEEAQWFYEDFIRPLDPTLPSMSLRSFCLRIFQHCPLLSSFSVENHMRAFEEFLQYKTRVPVRGAILLNHEMDSTVLVKGWKKGANWSFPRGKINKDEDDLDCAIREVYEETGFDIKAAGLVPKDDEVKYIQISMREQQIRLYVFKDIPMDTQFQPMTRKEISKIQWYKLSELPAFRKKGNHQQDGAAAASNANKFYMVAPFLVPLKKWVVQQKKKDARLASHSYRGHLLPEEPVTEDDIGTQTEPVRDPDTSTPAIETLEGATRELQRLLKIQPPNALSSAPVSKDKGAFLMEILQRGQEPVQAAPSQHQSYQQVPHGASQHPHTPLDLMSFNTSQPHTPHHHHPTHRLPANYSQPPPSLPLPPHLSMQMMPSSRGNAQQPQFYNHSRLPQQPTLHGAGYTGYNLNAHLYPENKHSRPPVLLHPQPLPPQVQQSLLVRGILPTPNLEMMANPAGYGHPNTNAYPSDRQPPVAPPVASQLQGPKLAAPQLTGHKLSLLNAFKNDGSRSTTKSSREVSATQPPHGPSDAAHGLEAQVSNAYGPHSKSNYPLASWTNHPNVPPSQPSPAEIANLVSGSSFTSPETQLPDGAMSVPSKPSQPSDKHRSALLDIFKKQGPLSPTSSEATIRPSKVPNLAPSPDGEDSQPKPLSSAEAIRAATKANGGPVRMNPEANLPFRALKILSRPKQPENNVNRNASVPQETAAGTASSPHQEPSPRYSTGYQAHPPPQNRSVSLPRENETDSPPNSKHAQQAGSPYRSTVQQSIPSPLVNPTFPGASAPARRQDNDPEQKQKLLSLFGKAQVSPTGTVSEEKGKGKEPAMYDQVHTGPPRSRVISVAGSGDVKSASMSRQNSQTPISPADRSFLLGYLQQVSNSNS